MDNLSLICTIMAIHFFAWLTPGPLFVLIIRNSLVYSRRTGVWTAVGFMLGNLTHITIAVTGVALLISSSDIAFNLIKYLGVGYLIYLGSKTLVMKVELKDQNDEEQLSEIAPLRAVRIGYLANILSPKATIFFASIFGGLLVAEAPTWVVGFLWIAMPLNTLMMASLLSLFFTQFKVRALYIRFQNIFNKLLGGALILLALMIALST